TIARSVQTVEAQVAPESSASHTGSSVINNARIFDGLIRSQAGKPPDRPKRDQADQPLGDNAAGRERVGVSRHCLRFRRLLTCSGAFYSPRGRRRATARKERGGKQKAFPNTRWKRRARR